ncbi:MAG: AIR synthase-related protein [Treponema sp.]
MQTYRFTVKNKLDTGKGNLFSEAHKKGFNEVETITTSDIYFVKCKQLNEKDISLLKDVLFADIVFQCCELEKPHLSKNEHIVEVLVKKEVSDSTVTETLRICKTLGIEIEEFNTGHSYIVSGNIKEERLDFLARTLLCNPINEYYSLSYIEPKSSSFKEEGKVFYFNIAKMNDDELVSLSNNRKLSLNLEEMKKIQSYFIEEKRECTDVELETIAQSWSEHCVHKTFKANISVDKNASIASNYPDKVRGVLKSYIKKATDELAKPWVISSFVDNAGIIELDDEYEPSFKVETHNHPSSLEPFGGANTGVGGVIRDIMGVSARPIATTDVLCFAPKDTSNLPEGTIMPEEMMEGIVEGVKDYGNKMGIPTVNGNIHFHPLYATNPLVYCGCVGICPRGKHKRSQQIGDRIISLGKRTGRDGIGGATFSSMLMGEKLENPPVQQGEPIIERKVSEVLIKARDEELYSAITDCGAGGYSSSVGEMASELGAVVELSNIKTKYEGLTPYEMWISETQERMVIAVAPKNISRLLEICEEYDVEASDLGEFTGDKRLRVNYKEKPVIDLACDFLHSGVPTMELKASFTKKQKEKCEYREPSEKEALEAICPSGEISIKESVVRLYDHEVQGGTILKPFMGKSGSVPQDAAVLKPIEVKSSYCMAISNSLHEREAMVDPYKAAFLTIDEAVRKLVAVGVEPSRIALLDNFCLGNSKDEKVLGDLLELSRACYDASKLFEAPFISGKDSFNNEYKTKDGSIAIPPSLLISAIGRIEDEKMVVSNGLKKMNSSLYLVGKPNFSFVGSLFEKIFGGQCCENSGVAEVPKEAPKIYEMLHECIKKGLILSSHSVGRGGVMKTLHEMKDGNLVSKFVLDFEKLLGTSKFLAYYGETASCVVVEVASEKVALFEKTMKADYRILIAKVVASKEN